MFRFNICVKIISSKNEDSFNILFGDIYIKYNKKKCCFELDLKKKNRCLKDDDDETPQPLSVCIESSFNNDFTSDIYTSTDSFWKQRFDTDKLKSVDLVLNTFDLSSISSFILLSKLLDSSYLIIYYYVISI